MRSKHKKKIRFGRIIIVLLFLVGIIFLSVKLINNNSNKVYMIDVTNKNIKDVDVLLKDYNIKIIKKYENNDKIVKDNVINQSIKVNEEINSDSELTLVISLGKKIDKEKMASDKINELGNVPIMMYHGIKNMKSSDTKYIGGNVDKDGYTRTVEAFREDLEFYYKNGYRMIKLSDYVRGNINTAYGYSPIVITFDDGNANNLQVTGLDSNGNIIIDEDSAVGVLEEFKKKYPDYNVTAIFFVTNALFNQPEYNEKILHWLVDNGYEVGNHTKGHNNFSKINTNETQDVVGYMYDKLNGILGDKYSKIIALPFGSPYNKTHANYKYIINGTYNGKTYETEAALRVGWEAEVSPYNKNFDKTFLKRCRAYDNNGLDFDIEMNFKLLEKNRYISDGDSDTIVTSNNNSDIINKDIDKELILY